MLCKIALGFSEDLVHVGPLKHLARINATLVIEGVAAISLHSVSTFVVQREHRANI
jgi:hypothetical protein